MEFRFTRIREILSDIGTLSGVPARPVRRGRATPMLISIATSSDGKDLQIGRAHV